MSFEIRECTVTTTELEIAQEEYGHCSAMEAPKKVIAAVEDVLEL